MQTMNSRAMELPEKSTRASVIEPPEKRVDLKSLIITRIRSIRAMAITSQVFSTFPALRSSAPLPI